MSWIVWLVLAAVVTAFAAVTGIKPSGTRHVAHTGLMSVARIALIVVVLIFLYIALRSYPAV